MSRKHVLVVDDEPAVRALVEGLLGHLGHSSESVDSGAAALRLIESTDFDLVVTDFRMPGMLGDQLAEQIKARKPRLPVILITGYEPPDLSPAVDRVLRKPFSLDELREAISALT